LVEQARQPYKDRAYSSLTYVIRDGLLSFEDILRMVVAKHPQLEFHLPAVT
jgi:hypothetical protein